MVQRDARSRSASSAVARVERTNRALVVVMLLMLIVTLSAVAWSLTTNLQRRSTPRTFVERQIAMLEGVVKQNPSSEKAWADYALALAAAKQYSRAQMVLDRADKALGGEVIDTAYVRAKIAASKGDDAKALELVKKAIDLGLEFRKKRLADLAEKGIFPEPRTIKGPIIAAAYYLQGELLARQGKWPEAAEALTRALEEEPASADALVLRGTAYLEMSETDSATADFKRALEFVPDFKPALDGLRKAGAATR